MTFAHVDHREQNCIVCHHNFADGTGQGLCLDCHLRDAALRVRLESQFHAMCRGCHVDLRRRSETAGPVRACHPCHQEENTP